MAVVLASYAASTLGNGSEGSSITVSKPSGVVEGDLLLAIVVVDGAETMNGLHVYFDYPIEGGVVNPSDPTDGPTAGIWVRIAGSSEPANYTWGWSGTKQAVAIIYRITGHRPVSTPADVVDASGANSSAGSSTPTSPSVTTDTPGCKILYIASNDGVATPYTPPPGTTLDIQGNSSSLGNPVSLAIARKDQTTAGATGTGVFTAGASEEWYNFTAAIAPPIYAGASISGSATVSDITPTVKKPAAAAIDGSGTTSASVYLRRFGESSIAGAGSVVGAANIYKPAEGGIAGLGAAGADALKVSMAYGDVDGVGTAELPSTTRKVFISGAAIGTSSAELPALELDFHTKFYSYSTTPQNLPPVADLAFTNIDALIGSIIQLDGRKSRDPEGNSLQFKWRFLQVPAGSGLTDTSFRSIRPSGAAVSFIPDILGLYVVELVVNDGELDSEPKTCYVNVKLSQVPIGEGLVPDAQFLWQYISNFWSLVEDRQYITSIWSSVIQLIGAEIIKTWSNDYNKSLKTIQENVQRRWQKVGTTTDLSSYQQRVIVGNTSDGEDGTTGDPGVGPGSGTTNSVYIPTATADLTAMDVNYGAKGRLIVINGEAVSISRITKKEVGGTEYNIVALSDGVVDGMVGVTWRVPHLLHVPGLDLEAEGVRPGDTLVFEVKRRDIGYAAELRAQIVGVTGQRIGFEFTLNELAPGAETIDRDLFYQLVRDIKIASHTESDESAAKKAEALLGFTPPGVNLSTRPFSRYRVTFRAKKILHNSVVNVADEAVSIPALQEQVYQPDVILRENLDYTVESGQVQFSSGLFTAADPAPEVFWAETIFYDNSGVIENNFGRLVNLSRDDLTEKRTRAPYLSAVKGLFYAMTNGPTIGNIRLGLQILLGLPFAEERGYILSIEEGYSTDSDGNDISRMLAEDLDSAGRRTGFRRTYFYPTAIGLETNPVTRTLYKAGDIIQQWSPVSRGVEVQDYVKAPKWWEYALRGLEILKFFVFRVVIDTQIFDTNDALFAFDFVRTIKPAYTRVVLSVLTSLYDDIDIEVSLIQSGTYSLYDDVRGMESTYKLNNVSSHGYTLWSIGSRPFSSRIVGLVRDLVTSNLGGEVVATSAIGWDSSLLRARIDADVPYSGAPVREGDILAIAPGFPGAFSYAWGLYEIKSVDSDHRVTLKCAAIPDDPTTYDFVALSTSTFNFGTNITATILRRETNPVLKGNDLSAPGGGNVVTSATAKFMSNGVGVDDHLIIESGANKGEYRIDAVPSLSAIIPRISETEVALKNLDGTTPTISVASSMSFRVIRYNMMDKVIEGAKSIDNGGTAEIHVLDPETGDDLDVFTPGLVGTIVNVSNSDETGNDGNFLITAYVSPGVVQTNGTVSTDDTDAVAVLHLNSPWHPGFDMLGELKPNEVFEARLENYSP